MRAPLVVGLLSLAIARDGKRATALLVAGIAVALSVPTAAFLGQRLIRNLFTPAIPRAVEPRYPLVEEAQLVADITVVVGTKDAVTPSVTQVLVQPQAWICLVQLSPARRSPAAASSLEQRSS